MYILIFFKISSIPPSTVKSISVFYNDWAWILGILQQSSTK
jgi:hypothetical protein